MTKPKYTIRLLKSAEDDLKDIVMYIALDNPKAADAMADKIEKSLSNLERFPLIGKIPSEQELANMGYRFLIIQNYLIFYTLENNIVLIHRIIHGARNYSGLL